ncbi:MAG: amidohydrolase family protein [Acidimicrobiales bacterium]
MRVIALEEHYTTSMLPVVGTMRRPDIGPKLEDLGAGRIADMDSAGIDLQVLSPSSPGTHLQSPADAIATARDANDQLADAVAAHPSRFAGFAVLPMPDPEAAAAELERCVTTLGFKGAMVHGHVAGTFLDDPAFSPVFASAESLGVPVYLHPTPPTPAVFEAYFSNLPGHTGSALAGAAWGWHAETGLHALRLVLGGVFDRFPRLTVVIGHMGENIPFSLARADSVLSPMATHLKRRVAEYFYEHFYFTTSAYFTLPPFQCALSVFGIDRLLFSVDYPFSDNLEGRRFLDNVPLSPGDLEKLAHGNAEQLLDL